MKRAILLVTWFMSVTGLAGTDPVSTAGDPRVRVVPYSATNVVQILSHTGIGTTIQLYPGEEYVTYASGAMEAFTLEPLGSGGRLILKPILSYADTNLTIYTNQRTYLFELKIRDPKKMGNGVTNNVRDGTLTYMLYFTYPEAKSRAANQRYQQQRLEAEKAAQRQCESMGSIDPSSLSFNYKMSGSKSIAPIAVYDDGVFTYFTFHPKAPIPSVYSANQNRDETAMNTRMEGRHVLVVEQLAERFTLRLGNDVVSVVRSEHPVTHTASKQETTYAGW